MDFEFRMLAVLLLAASLTSLAALGSASATDFGHGIISDNCSSYYVISGTPLDVNCGLGFDGDVNTATDYTPDFSQFAIIYNFTFTQGFGLALNMTVYGNHSTSGSDPAVFSCFNESEGTYGPWWPPNLVLTDGNGAGGDMFAYPNGLDIVIPETCHIGGENLSIKVEISGDGYSYHHYDFEFTMLEADSVPPSVTIYNPQNTSYTSVSRPLQVFANETIDTWWYSLNGGSNTTFTPNTTITASQGSNALIVYANDTVGNTGEASVYFFVDSVSPNVTIILPQNTTYESTSVTLEVSSDSVVDTWWYSLNSGSNTTFTPNTTVTAIEGSNSLVVYANDTLGNLGLSEVYFTVTIPVVELTGIQAVLTDAGSGTGMFLSSIQDPLVNVVMGLGVVGGIIAVFLSMSAAFRRSFSGATSSIGR